MNSWLRNLKAVIDSDGRLVVKETPWAKFQGFVAGGLIDVAFGGNKFLSAIWKIANPLAGASTPNVWIFDKSKGILLYHASDGSPAVAKLFRLAQVCIRVSGPFHRASIRPTDPKIASFEHEVGLEFYGGNTLILIEPQEDGDEVADIANTIADYLTIPVVRINRTPHLLGSIVPWSGPVKLSGSILPDAVRKLADAEQRIQAILLDRKLTGRGMADSKAAVDCYLNARKAYAG